MSDAADTPAGPIVTDTHFYETPPVQAVGVYSPIAQKYLPQLQVQHYPAGHIQGFTLQNGASSTKVDILRGEATDSGGTIDIQNASTCTVNLNAVSAGLGGLDVSGGPAANTTYFFFVTSAADGGNPNCIASASLTPSFLSTPYTLPATGTTKSGSAVIYNVTSGAGIVEKPTLGGVTGGDYVGIGGGAPVKIATVGTFNFTTTGTWANSSSTIGVLSTAGVGIGMAISDPTTNCIPKGSTISAVGRRSPSLAQPVVPQPQSRSRYRACAR